MEVSGREISTLPQRVLALTSQQVVSDISTLSPRGATERVDMRSELCRPLAGASRHSASTCRICSSSVAASWRLATERLHMPHLRELRRRWLQSRDTASPHAASARAPSPLAHASRRSASTCGMSTPWVAAPHGSRAARIPVVRLSNRAEPRLPGEPTRSLSLTGALQRLGCARYKKPTGATGFDVGTESTSACGGSRSALQSGTL